MSFAKGSPDYSTGSYAIGDWVLTDKDRRVRYLLDRSSLLQRRAAGTGASAQLIAANVEVLFIVSSCNADFNVPRLERYLVLAHQAGCYPVVVLTKADTSDTPEIFIQQAHRSSTVPTSFYDDLIDQIVSFQWVR